MNCEILRHAQSVRAQCRRFLTRSDKRHSWLVFPSVALLLSSRAISDLCSSCYCINAIQFWVIKATYALLRISRHYAFLTLVKCSGEQTALAPREPLYIRHLRLMASNDPSNAVEGKRYLYHGSPFISDIVTFVLLSFLFSTKLSYASIVTLSSFIWPGWTCLYYFGNISPVTYGHLTQRLASYFVTAQVRRK